MVPTSRVWPRSFREYRCVRRLLGDSADADGAEVAPPIATMNCKINSVRGPIRTTWPGHRRNAQAKANISDATNSKPGISAVRRAGMVSNSTAPVAPPPNLRPAGRQWILPRTGGNFYGRPRRWRSCRGRAPRCWKALALMDGMPARPGRERQEGCRRRAWRYYGPAIKAAAAMKGMKLSIRQSGLISCWAVTRIVHVDANSDRLKSAAYCVSSRCD